MAAGGDVPVEPSPVVTIPALRAEYDRLAAEVSKTKPSATPEYKALRESKRLAFAAWYEASQK